MAQTMDMGGFCDAASLDRSANGFLHVLDFDGLGVAVVANACREEPLLGTVCPPELSEHKEGPLRQRHIPLLGAFAQNPHHHARAVDILDLEESALAQAQTTRIDRGQAGPIDGKTDRR